MTRADLKKGQLLYKYELALDGSDRFDLKTFRVTVLGSEFYGVVRIGKNGEPRSGVTRERLQYFSVSYGTTPEEAKANMVKEYEYTLAAAERRVVTATRLLAVAKDIKTT